MLAKRWNQKGKVIILSETTDSPITLAGEMAGLCWGADTSNPEKNFKRGLSCFKSGHNRTMEYAQVYMLIDGYSARCIREFERHIGGAPTFLQESTRYIDYKNFQYVVPHSIQSEPKANKIFTETMSKISEAATALTELGVPREDVGMLYPLAMETKVVHRTNLRNLFDMAQVRKCTRAYWEYRELFKDIEDSLSLYSDEWKYLIEEYKIFKTKCEILGYCNEERSCGRMKKKEE